jgi:hypothetical protein
MLIPALVKRAGRLPWNAGAGEVQPKLAGTSRADAARLADAACWAGVAWLADGWRALAEPDAARAASPRVAAQAAAGMTRPVLEMFIVLPSFVRRRDQGGAMTGPGRLRAHGRARGRRLLRI